MTVESTVMMRSSSLYKWAQRGVHRIQSGVGVFCSQLLSALLLSWYWIIPSVTNYYRQLLSSISQFGNYAYTTWEKICSSITIEEIVATAQVISPENSLLIIDNKDNKSHYTQNNHSEMMASSILPVLRLNSVTMEEYLSATTQEMSIHEKMELGKKYSSASDDYDSGLVLTDPDENELSSSDEVVTAGDLAIAAIRLPQSESFGTIRRHSDSSDNSSDGVEPMLETKQAVGDRLVAQVESMFSDDHLAKDGFLLKHVRRRSDGFVSLKLVAGLRKVKQINRDFHTVLESLRKSNKLEVNEEGTKIRRIDPLTSYLKALPITGNKEKENKAGNGASSDSAMDEREPNQRPRHGSFQSNGYRRNQRNNSIVSTTSSNGSYSRNGSFSKPTVEPLFRNMIVYAPDESSQSNAGHIRRRGGSLPMPVVMSSGGQQHFFPIPPVEEGVLSSKSLRNSLFLSPPTGSLQHSYEHQQAARQKSNSYCEGAGRRSSGGGMSLWLQRRNDGRTSEPSVVVSGVVRQPRGPDGTRGFPSIYQRQRLTSIVAM